MTAPAAQLSSQISYDEDKTISDLSIASSNKKSVPGSKNSSIGAGAAKKKPTKNPSSGLINIQSDQATSSDRASNSNSCSSSQNKKKNKKKNKKQRNKLTNATNDSD